MHRTFLPRYRLQLWHRGWSWLLIITIVNVSMKTCRYLLVQSCHNSAEHSSNETDQTDKIWRYWFVNEKTYLAFSVLTNNFCWKCEVDLMCLSIRTEVMYQWNIPHTSHLNPSYIFVSPLQKLFSICEGLFPIFARLAKPEWLIKFSPPLPSLGSGEVLTTQPPRTSPPLFLNTSHHELWIQSGVSKVE